MGRLVGGTLVASVSAVALVLLCARVVDAQAVKGSLVGNIMRSVRNPRCLASPSRSPR